MKINIGMIKRCKNCKYFHLTDPENGTGRCIFQPPPGPEVFIEDTCNNFKEAKGAME